MLFLKLSTEEIALIILAIAVIPIIILMVYAIIIAVRRGKIRSRKRSDEALISEDTTQRELFLDVFGGETNIKAVSTKLSRISVDVENLELVKLDELKELGATGILLVGNTVKCAFGDRAPYIYELIKKTEVTNE